MSIDEIGLNGNAELSSTDLHNPSYNLFILILTIFSLLVMAFLLAPWLSPATKVTLQFIDTIICIIFLGDFFSNLHRSPDNRVYFFKQGGWLDLVGSVPSIPRLPWTAFLRLARMGSLVRIIRSLRGKDLKEIWADIMSNRAKSALMITALVALVVMTVSAMVVLQVESRAPDANILTGGDAFWWAFVTVTTVGYGDQYPVTALGRSMAMLLMVVGVGIFGVFTSFLSSNFFGPVDGDIETYVETVQLESDIADIKKEMAAIKEMLQELTD